MGCFRPWAFTHSCLFACKCNQSLLSLGAETLKLKTPKYPEP